jgi:hypothetical protein
VEQRRGGHVGGLGLAWRPWRHRSGGMHHGRGAHGERRHGIGGLLELAQRLASRQRPWRRARGGAASRRPWRRALWWRREADVVSEREGGATEA